MATNRSRVLRSWGARLLNNTPHRTDLIGWTMSPTGRHLATGAWVGDSVDDASSNIAIWEVATGRCVNVIPIEGGVGWLGTADCLVWSRDERRLGLKFQTSGVGMLDPFGNTGVELAAFGDDASGTPTHFCWSPESDRFFLCLWGEGDAVPGAIETPSRDWFDMPMRTLGTSGLGEEIVHFKEVAWRADGLIVGSSIHDGHVFAVDANAEGPPPVVWHRTWSGEKTFSPDGRRLAIALGDRLTIVDTASGAEIATAELAHRILYAAFSQDGEKLAVLCAGPDDRFRGEKLHIFVRDRRIDTVALREEVRRRHPALGAMAWSMDGEEFGVLDRGVMRRYHVDENVVTPAPSSRGLRSPTSEGLFYAADRAVVLASPIGLTFVAPDDAVIAERPFFELPPDQPLETDILLERTGLTVANDSPGVVAFADGGEWGYLTDEWVIAEGPVDHAVQLVVDNRHALSVALAKLERHHRRILEPRAGETSPPTSTAQPAATREDLFEYMVGSLRDARTRYATDAARYQSEVALQLALDGRLEAAAAQLDEARTSAEAAPHGPGPLALMAIAHAAAYLARAGGIDAVRSALRWLTTPSHLPSKPQRLADVGLWIGVVDFLVNRDDEWLSNALAAPHRYRMKVPIERALALAFLERHDEAIRWLRRVDFSIGRHDLTELGGILLAADDRRLTARYARALDRFQDPERFPSWGLSRPLPTGHPEMPRALAHSSNMGDTLSWELPLEYRDIRSRTSRQLDAAIDAASHDPRELEPLGRALARIGEIERALTVRRRLPAPMRRTMTWEIAHGALAVGEVETAHEMYHSLEHGFGTGGREYHLMAGFVHLIWRRPSCIAFYGVA